jgi:hypothetical protein
MNISLAKVHIEHLVAYIYKESKLCKDWKFAPYIPHETIFKKKVRHKCLLCLGWFLQAFIDFVHHILASKRWNTWNLYITISDGVWRF